MPNILLEVDSLTEADLGYLIYFFEKACAISGYMLGVNPFNPVSYTHLPHSR